MSNYKLYAWGLGLLFAAFVAVEYYRPKPIDWKETYSSKDKIPYGTYVLYELLPDLFKQQPVQEVRLPIASQLEEAFAHDDSTAGPVNYLFVNATFGLDSLDLLALLEFVESGNNVFISAKHHSKLLEDTLGFSTDYSEKEKQDSLGLWLTHPQLAGKKPVAYAWEKIDRTIAVDSGATARVLGKNSQGEINFIQVPFGRGSFYLSSVPGAFTNYYVLKPRQNRYAAQALSHLPVAPVWWDEYQKQGPVGDASVFRVLLNHDALTWAYYIALGSLFLFVVFESKRTQRIIPILEKPKNTTLEFVKVIGNLYYNHRDHRAIAEKKVNYFLEYLRLHYYESTSELDHELEERLSLKTGVAAKEIADLFRLVHQVKAPTPLPEAALWQLNQKLESFYRQARR